MTTAWCSPAATRPAAQQEDGYKRWQSDTGSLRSQREVTQLGPRGDADKRSGPVEKAKNLPPVAHERFKLIERVHCFGTCQRDQASPAGLDRRYLRTVLLDTPVARDDQPSLAGGFWNPHVVAWCPVGDRAGRPDTTALHWAARITGVSHISPDLHEDLGKAKYVGVM